MIHVPAHCPRCLPKALEGRQSWDWIDENHFEKTEGLSRWGSWSYDGRTVRARSGLVYEVSQELEHGAATSPCALGAEWDLDFMYS